MNDVLKASSAARAVATVLLTGFAVGALGAESPRGEDAQPAVSGDALQNLNRDDAASKAEPAAQTAPAAPAERSAQERETAAPRQSGARADRLELETTVVTGNRELPKVLYIVPWKKADLGDLPAQPFNTLLDEVLTPVDRDVFRREVTYYEAVSSGGDAGGAAAAPSGERSEK